MVNRVLLVYVPSREGIRAGEMPLGLLYVGSILESLGIKVKIFDLYLYDFLKNDRYGYFRLKNVIDVFNPDIIGFGGIATSYTWTKELSVELRKEYPKIMQIAGGALSSVYELLLTRAAIDIVFHGETEISLPLFLEELEEGTSYNKIAGISYSEDGKIIKNQHAPKIKDLDEIPFPSYHLVDIEQYFISKQKILSTYKEDMIFQGLYESIVDKLKHVENFVAIVTSRGCLYHCSFCYRHIGGYRKHGVEYVINHIKYFKDQFGVNGFLIADELFNGDMKWVMEFCDAIEKNKLKIAYRAAGARADRVSEEMLRRLYETGCVNVNYGQESGSNRILKEYRKGISREKNAESTLLTRKCGIYSTVQLVIGSPGETNKTIMETIDFLKKAKAKYWSINYLIPLPGTPIWNYVMENNLIDNVEDYLALVAKKGGSAIVNLTKAPDREWRNWANFISYKINFDFAKRSDNFFLCLKLIVEYYLKEILPVRIKEFLKSHLKLTKH